MAVGNTYDVIVIGGGHNGLTTAAFLAKSGKKVLVLEKNPEMGGLSGSKEFHPGFRTNGILHDTSQIRPWIVDQLRLDRYGFSLKPGRAPVLLISRDGMNISLRGSLEAAVSSIEKISRADAEAYRKYQLFIDKIRPFVNTLMNEVPPENFDFNPAQLWNFLKKSLALKRLGKTTMLELFKVAPMSVRDFLDEYFETDFFKAGLSMPALSGSVVGPYASYTTLNLLLYECTSNSHVVGGPSALISALQQAGENEGVHMLGNAEVQRIELDNAGRVGGVLLSDGRTFKSQTVAAACCPKHAILDLIDPRLLEYPLERAMTNYRARGVTAKLHLALKGSVNWRGTEGQTPEFIRLSESLEELERASDAVKYGRFGDNPILDIFMSSTANPNSGPHDHQVMSVLVHFIPYHLKENWTEDARRHLQNVVMDKLGRYVPGIKEQLIHAELLCPKDLEEKYGLTSGHINHGEHAIDQLLTRPVPSCAAYKTPIPGLFVCGSGSFPGGGVTCAPGALASKAILNLSKGK